MSHELRTPLNAILGFSELMTRDPNLSAAQRENLETINRSGEHLLALINDVLEFSKIEAGRLVRQAEDFDLYHMLLGLEEMFRLRAEKKGLVLWVQREPTVPQFIRTDQGKLRQVLINLLGNAVKFTATGQITLRSCLVQTGATPLLHFEVEDTGPGISAVECATLFNAFVQTASGRQTQEGTGLGLAISREFVRVLGGELSVHSQLEQGSTFEFDIPIEVMSLSERSRLLPQTTLRRVIGLQPEQQEYRVLIAEDVETNRRLLSRLLAPLGFQIQEAVNGQEAIEIWARWQPQVILMDMRMPVLDGHAAVRHIKATAQGQQTVIIALTASAFEEDRTTMLADGCDGFVRKPFREAELLHALADWAGMRFKYQEDMAGPEVIASNEVWTEAQLLAAMAKLSREWLKAFEQVALDGDVSALLDVIDQLQPVNQPLADRLAELTQAFQLDQLLNLVRRAIALR
jgi:CheY-like chemotaxis protein